MNKPKSTVFERLGEWFLKESGKKFVFGSAVAASISIAAVNILPHTFLLNQFRDVVRLYKNGFTVPVPSQIEERFDRTLNLLEIPDKEQKQFKPFMVYGFDIFSAGTFSSKYGVIVGIPISFSYSDGGVIDKNAIRINEQSVPWELEEGKLLLKSLTLSEKAQIYAMAREIELRKTAKYFIDTFGAVASFIAAYGIGNHLNTKLNLFARPRAVRLTLYTLKIDGETW
ncbi:hypothetical protein ILUMI_23676 [Ignelater luminosus]|uniref:Uncharacterized protein n=1 Tax=Ignelater luminosus TaxID=2038154 RepID=A0A8K0FZF6_IGNLU|nr:hypothetical protein ILUMI_23676 [Ignelater luminosus]